MPEPPRPDNERVGSWALLAAAVAAVVLYGIGLAALGLSPAATESGRDLVSWFGTNGDNVRWFVWSITVATPLSATTFALLRRLLPPPYRDVFLIGVVSTLATTAVYTWTWAGLALHADKMRPAVMRALLDIAIFYGPVLTGSTTTMMAPVNCWRCAVARDFLDGSACWARSLLPSRRSRPSRFSARLDLPSRAVR